MLGHYGMDFEKKRLREQEFLFRTVTTKRIFQSNLRPSRFIAGNKKLKVETVAKSLNKKISN